MITVSGVIVLVGAILPWLVGSGFSNTGGSASIGSTLEMLEHMDEIDTWWPALLLVCGLALAGVGVLSLVGVVPTRAAGVVALVAAIGVGAGLVMGPFRYPSEFSSVFYSIGWFPTGDAGSISLGWGVWVMAVGGVVALLGAVLAIGRRAG